MKLGAMSVNRACSDASFDIKSVTVAPSGSVISRSPVPIKSRQDAKKSTLIFNFYSTKDDFLNFFKPRVVLDAHFATAFGDGFAIDLLNVCCKINRGCAADCTAHAKTDNRTLQPHKF